ncbi:hypothetical protein BAY00_13765 [Elizabethkingia bruuniana]|nr:hypothetical protein BAY00_13765 [Elizabethkingia bruuniana]
MYVFNYHHLFVCDQAGLGGLYNMPPFPKLKPFTRNKLFQNLQLEKQKPVNTIDKNKHLNKLYEKKAKHTHAEFPKENGGKKECIFPFTRCDRCGNGMRNSI